ncbi:G-type lectin S-receptor-like serine/threonine-protein kinase RLK1 [Prunus yedoensis var. nudiflora]|uniref:non-specific serine/threonine protein kinase n=1 Tax=Prunus yedoensis var. nudiflora TaxID=2094558 RepID=A0A314YS40_PRUYE|nr:G-type lectin S-receptor-like serine/threonine-protein kinase RLK1 [Prunus yedoensis var. nudiflora]
MQPDGNLVQYPVNPISPTPQYAYWNTETYTAGDNVSLNLDHNGQLYLPIPLNNSWSIEYSSSSDKCAPLGLCGLNAYCVLIDEDPPCLCLPGFVFIDQGQKDLGCRRNFSTVDCANKNETRYSITDLDGLEWEDNPYSVLTLNETACKEDCLRDCDCEGAVYKDKTCRKQKFPLRYGRTDKTGSTLVKIGIESKGRNKQLQTDIFISGVAMLTFALIILAITGVVIYRYRVWGYKKIPYSANGGFVEDVTLRSYTYVELEKATKGFTDEVGKGAFGTVYKGVISNGGRVVAIKKLEKVVGEGEREFQNEVNAIGRTHHKNLVKLLGYCHDGSNRLLVYEYMTNGSLADFLFRSDGRPAWEERTGIVLNVAQGILYLHEECETQIIHCDIKPENILMSEQKCAKLADFGLAKLLKSEQTRTHTRFRGTRGYVAPEWHRNMPITVKADVYSFGVVLLEIICCRRSVNMDIPEDQVVLENWVYHCLEADELHKLVQDEEVDKNKLGRMIKIGLWCIQDEPSLRPSMKKVVLMLEGTVEIPPPPNPDSFFSSKS